MLDGVTSPAPGYASVGYQPAETVPVPAAQTPQPVTPVAAPVPAPQQQQQSSQRGPTVVPDFASGVAGSYVLDWRDQAGQVLVQIPMRTAFAQFANAGAGTKLGKTVDTEA